MERGLRHAAAVLAMICLTTGFTGLSGLIWTGAQQQRVYDDLIRQTKRESVLLSRTKNGGENGSVQRTRVSVEELQERRLEQANAGNKAAGSATGGQKHRGRLENQQTAKQAQMKQAQTKQTVIDFDALKKINPDVVSWITIPGTNIDYPLLQGKDNNQYLHKDMEGRDSAAGAIFLDHGDKADLSSLHNIIYGHHMKNGSMFAALEKYTSEEFYREHPEILFDTLEETGRYQVAAVFKIPGAQITEAFAGTLLAATEEDYNAFIAYAKEHSLYDTGVTPQWPEQLLTLGTCEYTYEDGS